MLACVCVCVCVYVRLHDHMPFCYAYALVVKAWLLPIRFCALKTAATACCDNHTVTNASKLLGLPVERQLFCICV